MLLCEQNVRDVCSRNESVRAEIGQILPTDTHTHAAKVVVGIVIIIIIILNNITIIIHTDIGVVVVTIIIVAAASVAVVVVVAVDVVVIIPSSPRMKSSSRSHIFPLMVEELVMAFSFQHGFVGPTCICKLLKSVPADDNAA